jgi:hypothetical protein
MCARATCDDKETCLLGKDGRQLVECRRLSSFSPQLFNVARNHPLRAIPTTYALPTCPIPGPWECSIKQFSGITVEQVQVIKKMRLVCTQSSAYAPGSDCSEHTDFDRAIRWFTAHLYL